jgi:DNA-binding MarR family transcriptional regulator
MATRNKRSQEATQQLAARFLDVVTHLFELTKLDNPDGVVAQLSVKQLQALDLIRREPGISQKALAERLEVTSASVSIWIGKMVEAQLVERWAHNDDARVMHLYLGPYGRELVNKLQQAQVDTIADFLNDLPLEDQQLVVETLERALTLRAQRPETRHVGAESA